MSTPPLRRSGSLALASAALLLGLSWQPAEARRGARHGHAATARMLPPKADRKADNKDVAAANEKHAEPARTWTAGEPGEKSCLRSRRKLWQPGEGWMVKRVNVCP